VFVDALAALMSGLSRLGVEAAFAALRVARASAESARAAELTLGAMFCSRRAFDVCGTLAAGDDGRSPGVDSLG
jgi:hypothetical protein